MKASRDTRRRKLFIILCVLSVIFIIIQLYTFFYSSFRDKTRPPWQQAERHLTGWELQQLYKQSYENVKQFIAVCKEHHVQVFLVDQEILARVMSNHSAAHSSCKYLCVRKTFTSFAVLADKWESQPEIIQSMQKAGFQMFVFTEMEGSEEHVTTHYLLQQQGHAVHLMLLYHRLPADYWWHGPLTVAHLVQGDLQILQVKLANIPFSPHQGAYDKMEVVKVEMDGIRMYAPKYPKAFLRQIPSHFIPCNHSRSHSFHSKYGKDKSSDAITFRKKAIKVLKQAKKVLDELGMPFWMSSGTCLGWFRQCDIIPYSHDVDLGIWIKHYDVRLIPAMQMSGLPLKHLFGKTVDSFELSFQGGDVKLDIFFFYEDGDIMWNGGTQAKTGKKFKYIFPKFSLCWTEFYNMKIGIPCETQHYLEANYGTRWFEPVTKWDWKTSPPNVYANGQWPKQEWNKVIQTFDV